MSNTERLLYDMTDASRGQHWIGTTLIGLVLIFKCIRDIFFLEIFLKSFSFWRYPRAWIGFQFCFSHPIRSHEPGTFGKILNSGQIVVIFKPRLTTNREIYWRERTIPWEMICLKDQNAKNNIYNLSGGS